MIPLCFVFIYLSSCVFLLFIPLSRPQQLLLFTILFFASVSNTNISEDCMGQVDGRVDKLYLSVFHWEYSPCLYLIALFPFRLQSPTVGTSKPLGQYPFLHRKILVSLSFLFQISFALHQYVILSSNKWNFEDLIISQEGSNLLLPNFRNSEALLIIKYSCLAKLYMYIYLYLHLPISLTIYSDMNTY